MQMITEAAAARLRAIRQMVDQGHDRLAVRVELGLSSPALNSLLSRSLGTCNWPPEIPESLTVKQPYDDSHPGGGRRDAGIRTAANVMDSDALALRVAADQAALRANREYWLQVEAEKYNLPLARSIDGMPA